MGTQTLGTRAYHHYHRSMERVTMEESLEVLVDLTKISKLLTPASFMAKSNIRQEARNVQKYIGLWMEYDTLRRAPSEMKSLARLKKTGSMSQWLWIDYFYGYSQLLS